MKDYTKRFFTCCFALFIVILGTILVGCKNDEREYNFPDVPLFLEITATDNDQFDYENRFEISSTLMISQRPGFVRTSANYWIENVEIGETEFPLPIRPSYIRQNEIVEFEIYQITEEMVVTDDTNRFQDNEWISDQGWIIDETIFYLTVEFVVENETGRFEITKTRYENGNHVQVDEIRFINHYLGNDDQLP